MVVCPKMSIGIDPESEESVTTSISLIYDHVFGSTVTWYL